MRGQGTVFIVDDDPGARRSMCWLLESEGLEVEAFPSARDFLAAYDLTRLGCLILDLRMPEIDGLELQEELTSRGSRLPIIFVSAYGDVTKCVAAMKGGAVHFLEKPVDDRELLELVQQALDKSLRSQCHETNDSELKSYFDSLTSREHEVMRLMFAGKTIRQIAAEFGIGYQTVAKHRARVLHKLHVENEADLVRLLAHHELRPR